MITAYHFVGTTLRNGDPIPPDGEWIEVAGPLVICERGLLWPETKWAFMLGWVAFAVADFINYSFIQRR